MYSIDIIKFAINLYYKLKKTILFEKIELNILNILFLYM